jgi:catechol 2,3-dioxygenase-like lactoylglutathione lyase family enzyme
MLPDRRAHATLPVNDLDGTRAFYEDVLGFRPLEVTPSSVLYRAGEGSVFALSRSSGKASGTHTQIGFTVMDIDAEVADLKRRGVTFLEYDLPSLKTVDSIAQTGPNRAAWFLDPEGNMIGVVQFDAAS